MKIRAVGAELFHADRRTDITKITVAFRNFANAPKKICICFSKRPERLWGPNNLFSGYQASLYSGGKAAGAWG